VNRFRFELAALAVAALFCVVHLVTVEPMVGLTREEGAGLGQILRRGIQALEGRALDLKFRLRGERPADPGVVVVELDERGVQRFGLWPWPRTVMAKALHQLLEARASAIGLDIAFTDASDQGGDARAALEHLKAEEALSPALTAWRDELEGRLGASPDDALEAAFREGGGRIIQGVIPYAEADVHDFSPETVAQHLKLLDPFVIRQVPVGHSGAFRELPIDKVGGNTQYSAQMPLPRFAAAGSGIGHFLMVPDSDGTVRRAGVLIKVTGARGFLPSMALRTAAVALDATIDPMLTSYGTISAVRLRQPTGEVVVPYENDDTWVLLNYPGRREAFSRLSIVDVIDGKFDPAQLAGKAVLMGVTIVGSSGDQRVTPFREAEPGIFTHAALVSSILSRQFLMRPSSTPLWEMLAMLGLALFLGVTIPRVSAFSVKALIIVGVLSLWLGVDLVSFGRGLHLSTVVPGLSLLASAFTVIFLGYLSVDREKLKLRSTFTRYLGEDVMEVALANPDRLNRGEKREMTVLFSDIRGFTTLSERMSPEALAVFINEYLSPMTQIVFDEKGTLDKYIGDALMAFWNAPIDQPDHALRACRAALAMLRRLDELKVGWRARGYPELEIGIGVNTGTMVVGNMGSDVRVDYTVLGDAVNLGSRLEGTTKEYGTRIIVSEQTWNALGGQLVGRRLGAVRVKGKQQPVGIFELRGEAPASAAEAEGVATFERALDLRAARQFAEAAQAFRRVLELWPADEPSRRYLAELETFTWKAPPPDWDAVFTMHTK
jgi:adenylate cyclase